jgi:O-antigen/teichoic acid export membrane protein
MSSPKIQIHIPSYNNAEYLTQCIQSCKDLTYQNKSIVVIDDHSVDHSQGILREMMDTNIKLIINDRNLGRIQNYQLCASLATESDWYINLDSDDYYTDHNWVTNAMDIVGQNQDDNIVHIQWNLLEYLDASKIKILKKYNTNTYLVSGIEYLKTCLKYYCFSHLGSIFHSKLSKKNGAYIDDCLHTDFLTAMRTAIQGNVLISNCKLGVWRQTGKNQSFRRYTDIEYAKNKAAHYRFFEWCEDYLSYSDLKEIVRIYDLREIKKGLMLNLNSKSSIRSQWECLIEQKCYSAPVLFVFLKNVIKIGISDQARLNIIHGLGAKVLGVLLSLFAIPIIYRSIGSSDFGWIGVYTLIVSVIFIFDFGMTNLISKEIVQAKSRNLRTSIVFCTQELFYIGLGVILFIILYGLFPFLVNNWLQTKNSGNDFEHLRFLLAFSVFCQWPISFYNSALYGLHKQIAANNIQMASVILKTALIILPLLLLSKALTITDFFLYQTISSVLTCIVFRAWIHFEIGSSNPFQNFSWRYAKEIKNLSIGLGAIGLFGFVYADLNNIFLSRWLSLSAFGEYNIIFNLVLGIILLTASIRSSLFPSISLDIIQKNDNIDSSYLKNSQWIHYICIPLCVFIAIHSHQVLNIWIGIPDLVQRLHDPLVWLSLGSLAYSFMVIPTAYLIVSNRTKYLLIQSLFLAIVSMPILWYLVTKYNIEGAGLYWLIINSVAAIVMMIYFYNGFVQHKIYIFYQSTIFPILTSIIIFYGLHFLAIEFNFSKVLYSLSAGLSFLFYFFVLFIFQSHRTSISSK